MAKYQVGQSVHFKSDIEQSAEIVEVLQKRNSWSYQEYKVIAPAGGFIGEYIGGMKFAIIDEGQIIE